MAADDLRTMLAAARGAVDRDLKLLDLIDRLVDELAAVRQTQRSQADDLRALSNRIEAVAQARNGLHSVKV